MPISNEMGMLDFYQDFVNSTLRPLQNLINKNLPFNKEQHIGFEAAAWYWHFVDVV